MRKAPEVIYLQWSDGENYEDNTWCQDQINDDDIEYIKKATATRRLELLRRCQIWIDKMSDELPGYAPLELLDELAKELAE